MKQILVFILLSFSSFSFAASPILQYGWHNQIKSSQLMVFENGSIILQERVQYRNITIPKESLSQLELLGLKKMISSVIKSKSETEIIEATLGSYSGTIELRSDKGLKIVEGIVRDSTDPYRAKAYRSNSKDIEKLKTFIFKYTNNDMEF